MRRRGVRALFACLAAFAIPAATASAAEYDTLPFEAKADDGVVLRGHVFLPKQAPRPLGTVLHLSPYFEGPGHMFMRTDQLAEDGEIAFLLDAGFAVAAVSMRGTGQSDGCMRFGDERDWRDGATVVQTLAAQPWSNGNVGMYGHSYVAWSQMMTAAARPPALKAIVPTSGVYDVWSLLTRRGAPLTGGLGTAFAPAFTATTGHEPPQGIRQICPELLQYYNDNFQLTTTGDRNEFFDKRDLRAASTPSSVPVMPSIGIISGVNDGHILELEGMWDRLGADREHWVLGQWSHEVPTDHKKDWHDQVIAWFDHYLRGGPKSVPTGVVEYQDDDDAWHTAGHWPPPGRTRTVRLSGDGIVPDGERVEPVDASFASADNDPGLRSDQPDDKTRLYNSTCGPHQVLFASRPFSEDVLLAGNIDVDVDLTSTLPGGNFSIFFWRTKGTGACPDQTATWFGRALMDLRHWETPGRSKDFSVGTPTRVRLRSHPMAAVLHKGERMVVAIGGGSSELEPDARHPQITVTRGSFDLPVVTGDVPSPRPPRPAGRCDDRRKFTFRLHHARGARVVKVEVFVNGKRKLTRRGRNIRQVTIKRLPRKKARVRIVSTQSTGSRLISTRTYRGCRKDRPRTRRG